MNGSSLVQGMLFRKDSFNYLHLEDKVGLHYDNQKDHCQLQYVKTDIESHSMLVSWLSCVRNGPAEEVNCEVDLIKDCEENDWKVEFKLGLRSEEAERETVDYRDDHIDNQTCQDGRRVDIILLSIWHWI